MRIVAKEGEPVNNFPDHRKYRKSESSSGFDLLELFNHLKGAILQILAAIRYRFDLITFGIFRNWDIPIFKISILAIIMLLIFKKESSQDLNLSENTPIFAAQKQIKEKTNGKHKAAIATPVSFGGISYDLSPASSEELRVEQVRSYIDRFSKIAISEMDKHGIPASITLAQGIIESRAGMSVLAQKNGNHFGIKCFQRNCPAGHCTNYTDDNHKDFFKKYANPWESWRDHSNILMHGNFKKLTKYGKNYKAWALGLRQYGYATDQTYDKKLISIIERYNLAKLDDL